MKVHHTPNYQGKPCLSLFVWCVLVSSGTTNYQTNAHQLYLSWRILHFFAKYPRELPQHQQFTIFLPPAVFAVWSRYNVRRREFKSRYVSPFQHVILFVLDVNLLWPSFHAVGKKQAQVVEGVAPRKNYRTRRTTSSCLW